MELSAIKGIGPTRLESLRAVGVCSLRDLLYFLPQRYEDRTHPIPCADANGGEVLVMGVVQDAPKLSRFNGLTRVTAYLWDDSGKLPLVWYNQPWMMQNLPVGQTVMLFGRMGQSRGKPVLQNAQRVTEPCILPVYRAVKGIPAKSFREMMQQALEQVDDCCPETLPNDLRIRHQLCELNFAIWQAHFPLNVENLRLARRRLAFEQMLMYQAALGLLRGHKAAGTALPIPPDAPDKFWQTLPFPPTGAQKRVLEEIAADEPARAGRRRLRQTRAGVRGDCHDMRLRIPGGDDGADGNSRAPALRIRQGNAGTAGHPLRSADWLDAPEGEAGGAGGLRKRGISGSVRDARADQRKGGVSKARTGCDG